MSSAGGVTCTIPARLYKGQTHGREAGADFRKFDVVCLHCKSKNKEKTNRPSRTKTVVACKSTTIDEFHRLIYKAFTPEEHQRLNPYGSREVVRCVPYSAGGPCPFPSGELLPYSRDGSLEKKLVLQLGNTKHGSRTLEELGIFDKSVNYIYFAFAYKGQKALSIRLLLKLIEKGPGEPLKNECKCHSVFMDDSKNMKNAIRRVKKAKLIEKITTVVDRTPLMDLPKYKKYKNKLKFLPEAAVRSVMMMDGLPSIEIDTFFDGGWEIPVDNDCSNPSIDDVSTYESRPVTSRPMTERTKALIRNEEENNSIF